MEPLDDLKHETAGNSSAPFVNISAYKFVDLDNLVERRDSLLAYANKLQLKGTVLLASEGINLFVAGTRSAIDQWITFLYESPEYTELPLKESVSDDQPFSRMLVRIKREIITFGVEDINPQRRSSPKMTATQLQQWLDEGKEFTLLDTRNDYEIELGTFEGATPIGVDNFRQFPAAVDELPDELKSKPLVMFCTGGIRCEKAGPFMEKRGFEEVYQLDGGILRYFEECGGEHYNGECFVFDKRVGLGPDLQETETTQCYACQHPLTAEEQQSEQYEPGRSCPHCYLAPQEIMQQQIAKRQLALAEATKTLPGSTPYHNQRPLNVPASFDHFSVIDFLCGYHPHISRDRWTDEIAQSRILYHGEPVAESKLLRSGMRLDHLLPETTEPDVAKEITILFEDSDLIVVDKPAPLPMHPCGRFNRNSLIYLIGLVYSGEKIRMAHRLDANTSGCVILTRKKAICHQLQKQFETCNIQKVYLARVQGTPQWDIWTEEAGISSQPTVAGVREIDPNGLRAITRFKKLHTFNDGTTLLECRPETGRTNQIRLHLWHLALPILGDPVFLPEGQLGNKQTLAVTEPPMCLHASSIKFEHPRRQESVTIEAPRPAWSVLPST